MKIERIFFLFTVFVTGAGVLITEVAAIRLLSIQFGASMDVVSGVLAVILLSLSVGYYVGGRLSDKYPNPRVLYAIILAGGLLLLITSSLGYTILHPALDLQTSLGPIMFSFLLFFLPAFLLGMDSPYIIKLQTLKEDTEQHGKIVGQVFFWSTTGSIIGSLAAGFYLLPQLGVRFTFLSTSLTLIILGCIGVLTYTPLTWKHLSRKRLITYTSIIGFTSLIVYATTLTNQEFSTQSGVIYEGDGLYSHIIISEYEYKNRTIRALKRDVNNSSAIYPNSTDIVYPYLKPLPDQIRLHGDVEKMLQIGGGGYTGPKAVLERFPEIQIDVAEIEPILFELAHTYFELPKTPTVTNYITDGRTFLRDTKETYDLIYIDAFGSGHYIPPNLVSIEFFEQLKQRLSPDGLLVINFVGIPSEKEYASVTGSLLKTVSRSFAQTSVYLPNEQTFNTKQNILVHARMNISLPTTFSTTTEEIQQLINFETIIHEEDVIFTDEFPKVEQMISQNRW